MDLPLKVDIPKLSHLNILDLLCPFIPGIVVAFSLQSDRTDLFSPFRTTGLGYRTIVIISAVLVYVAGIAMMNLTVTVSNRIYQLIKPQDKIDGSLNSYWRRLATAYVGRDLAPMGVQGGAFSSDVFEPAKRLREAIETYEKALQTGSAALAKAREAGTKVDENLPTSIAVIDNALVNGKSALQTYDASMRKINTDREWATLYNALSRIKSTQHPFAAYGLLSASLQTAAIGALCAMIHNGRSWGVAGTGFCIAVAVSASFAGWQIYKLNSLSKFLGTAEVADLIEKIRNQSATENGPEPKFKLG
jgi:hypothetical protein